MADNFFVPMAAKYLAIEGTVSSSTRDAIAKGLPDPLPDQVVLLFLSYANFEAPLGQVFDIIFSLESPELHQETSLRLLAVTQDFAKPFEAIPRGWKTIAAFQCENSLPPWLERMRALDAWDFSPLFGLASRPTWSLLVEPPDSPKWMEEGLWRYTPLLLPQSYFTCEQCRHCADAGHRWAHWNLERPKLAVPNQRLDAERILQAGPYWNFVSRNDRLSELTIQSLKDARTFLELHRHHEMSYRPWGTFNGFQEFSTH